MLVQLLFRRQRSASALDAARGERGGRDLGYRVDVQTSGLGEHADGELVEAVLIILAKQAWRHGRW